MIGVLERECSLQRRHQKVIEECPSPVLDEATRARMIEASTRLAKAAGYRNAGTLEFLLSTAGEFFFLEMNTRLQVEHPVTELAAGIDLVEWQIRIAAGERLSIKQEDVRPRGAAIEARVYAEDPDAGFLPQAGPLRVVAWPSGPGIRVDSGVVAGSDVSAHYDPMLAKIVAYGADRDEARRKLIAALLETAILGVATNVSFLIELLESDAFRKGAFDVNWIEREFMKTRRRSGDVPREAWLLAAAALAAPEGVEAARTGGALGPTTPWDLHDGFSLTPKGPRS
jgi:acetyl/propionyl-CoA carboxylase alpha subunit